MKFRTTKNPVFCPMGLRRAMQSALAIVATLALVSSAQAQTTYTWGGGGGEQQLEHGGKLGFRYSSGVESHAHRPRVRRHHAAQYNFEH